jgi:hydroxypyruvate reductase
MVAAAVTAAARGDTALVLISGGTSSLVGAPADGVDEAGYDELVRTLLRSGIDIAALNAERSRVSRWGGGRLARALAARGVGAIRVLLVSDVAGDDPAVIGSGPCALDDGDPAARLVTHQVVAGNRTALDGGAHRARELGYHVVLEDAPLAGEARVAGEALAERLLGLEGDRDGVCLLAGGETTVALGMGAAGTGGRAQELSLAASRVLAERPEGRLLLLAAGTDGRDGPTDAAGAVVTPSTWAAVRAAGLDPAEALARHDAYPALDGAGALLRTGQTGTNVMDVVVGLIRGGAEAPGGSRARR